jgi:CheY-like chemotaxis protein
VVSGSVLLVEDVPELRSVIRQALKQRGGLEVVAEAADGATAVTAAATHQPDIVVLDLGLPDLAGAEVLTRIRAVSVSSQVVVYSGTHRAEELSDPVAAYVSKDRDVAYLVDLLTNLDRPRFRTDAVELGPDTGGVPLARQFLRDRCREWACGEVVDDALLVTTELVTNALVHAGPLCELRAVLSGTVLRLQVSDSGVGMPDPRAAKDTDEGGRGLLLISALCAAWGTVALPAGGKVVWAELLRKPDDRRPPRPDQSQRMAIQSDTQRSNSGVPSSEVVPPAAAGTEQLRRASSRMSPGTSSEPSPDHSTATMVETTTAGRTTNTNRSAILRRRDLIRRGFSACSGTSTKSRLRRSGDGSLPWSGIGIESQPTGGGHGRNHPFHMG